MLRWLITRFQFARLSFYSGNYCLCHWFHYTVLFQYYVYKAFGKKKMKFHACKGVYLFLMLPYLIFVIVYAISNNLATAKNLFVLPVVYVLVNQHIIAFEEKVNYLLYVWLQ